jgi:hypothetical protein
MIKEEAGLCNFTFAVKYVTFRKYSKQSFCNG